MTADARAMLPAALLAAAEHDVRGLLQTVQLGAGTLSHELDGQPLGAAATAIARAADRLTATLSELVLAAGAVLDGEVDEAVVDVGELVSEVADRFDVAHVHTAGPGRLLVAGNAVILRHLFSNLVSNAVVGGPTGVQIRAWAVDGVARVMVSNPTLLESVPADRDGGLLHTRSGRGLKIVRVLADASDVTHTHEVVDGVFRSRLDVPRLMRHPSAGRTGGTSPEPGGDIIAIDGYRQDPATSQVPSE